MILIVEDDEHKSSQILEICEQVHITKGMREVVDNVRDAVRFLVDCVPRMIVLDMSLPSHKAQPGQGTPLPMPTGGIEILFELKKRNLIDLPVLILTQYHEIEIEGDAIPVDISADALREIYGFTSVQACYYEHLHGAKWMNVTKSFLDKK
ncbi:DNA-binding transcriptional response regulator [Klebsiella variicola]|uniref:hypothetical protein n=1 Tax=Klebsiella variicola TaxID=244366 RepID=UPI002B052ED7|nr:hypothetical protein [Klebsiella variicola]